MRREPEASADARPPGWRLADELGRITDELRRAGFLAGAVAAVERARQEWRQLRRVLRSPRLAGFRNLGLTWFTAIGFALAGAGVLRALGPPADMSAIDRAGRGAPPVAGGAQRSAQSVPAKPTAPPSISALLARAEREIIDTPDGPPVGGAAALTLQQVADALPNAGPDDRDLADRMAAGLYDRAKAALDGGRIDEEQRWLALGALLAPPPDLAPSEPQVAQQVVPQTRDQSASEPRQDLTPNEAEADATAPAERAAATGMSQQRQPGLAPTAPGPPTQARGTEAMRSPQPGTADRAAVADAVLPTLRPPGSRPPLAPQPEAAQTEAPGAGENAADMAAAGADNRVAIHFLGGSDFAETRAKALAERLTGAFGPAATQSAADVPPGAVIRYAQPADHARARQIGQMLGDMGYSWHLQRSPSAELSGAPALDVWLPAGYPVRITRPRYVVYARPRAWWSFLIPRWF
ncbi:MAG: hypothetical protein JO047_02285 [Alphaproteobacteria bacterium]|nr:hypothetical protein [Alphaproteobacteria bacterium]